MRDSTLNMTRQRFVLIGILFFHSVNTIMDRVAISAAKDGIISDLKISDQTMGYIFGIFALGYALFQIPSGVFADRYGPRKALAWVVTVWSAFTMLTGAAFNTVSMLVLRFLFGAGEAGAYPGATRAFYSWLPVKERGIAHGINFSGSRIGAALSLFLMPGLIALVGWRWTFVINGLIGIIWAVVWLLWFRDSPRDNEKVNTEELRYIEEGCVEEGSAEDKGSFGQIFISRNMLLAMFQYLSSNMTFFICFSWLLPYVTSTWGDEVKAYHAPIPLLVGACANWVSGGFVSFIYKRRGLTASRRIPAIVGFVLGTVGLIAATLTSELNLFILAFSVAVFGVDMTLSPSWSFCMDIGGKRSGSVSASMNMVGNIGSALSAIIFPYFVASVTIPLLAPEAGNGNSFFIFCGVLNFLSILAWLLMDPKRDVDRSLSTAAVKLRVALLGLGITAATFGAIIYKIFF